MVNVVGKVDDGEIPSGFASVGGESMQPIFLQIMEAPERLVCLCVQEWQNRSPHPNKIIFSLL